MLEFQKGNTEAMQAELILDLTRRVAALEAASGVEPHMHNGLDARKVRVRDLDKVLYKEFTFNPGNLADAAGETKSVTVSGAQLGDFVLVSAPYDLQDITVTGYVQAADTVEVRVQNESGGAVDLASGTWRVLIIKKFT